MCVFVCVRVCVCMCMCEYVYVHATFMGTSVYMLDGKQREREREIRVIQWQPKKRLLNVSVVRWVA